MNGGLVVRDPQREMWALGWSVCPCKMGSLGIISRNWPALGGGSPSRVSEVPDVRTLHIENRKL